MRTKLPARSGQGAGGDATGEAVSRISTVRDAPRHLVHEVAVGDDESHGGRVGKARRPTGERGRQATARPRARANTTGARTSDESSKFPTGAS